MRLHSLAFCLTAFVVHPGQAQTPATPPPVKRADLNAPAKPIRGLPPRLKLTESVAIDGRKEKLEREISVDLGPGGQIVVRSGLQMNGYDSTGRRLWSMERGRNGEIAGDLQAIGWLGSQMWVSDRSFSQIALIDKGVVTKSLELPSWVRPSFSNRKSFPVFAEMDVYAYFADGSMLVVPRGQPRSLLGASVYDSTKQYVVHVSESGIIDRTIASFSSRDFAYRAAFKKANVGPFDESGIVLPMSEEYWPRFRVAPDGMRTVTVSVDTSRAGVDTIVVEMTNEKGAPVYSRRFGFPRIAYSQEQIDSIALVRYSRVPPSVRAERAKSLPRHLPSVRDMVLGRDHTVWVTLRETDMVKPVVGIDPAGQVIGTLYLPRTVWLKAADRNGLWIVDYRPTLRDVVRYTVKR